MVTSYNEPTFKTAMVVTS